MWLFEGPCSRAATGLNGIDFYLIIGFFAYNWEKPFFSIFFFDNYNFINALFCSLWNRVPSLPNCLIIIYHLSHIFYFIVWSNQTWKEMFIWSLKPQHISLSHNFVYFPTKQNTEIWFGGEQIFTAKYKFQVLFVAKAQGFEHTLFSKGTSRFLRL